MRKTSIAGKLDFEKTFGSDVPIIKSAGTMLFDPVWALKEHMSSDNSDSEIIHVIRGSVQLQMNGQCYNAGPGETLLVPGKTPHRDSFNVDEELEVFFCRFSWKPVEFFFQYVDNDVILSLPASCKTEIMRNFDLMRGDFSDNRELDKMVLATRILTVLMLIIRAAANSRTTKRKNTRDGTSGKWKRARLMLKAKEFIDKNYADWITLDGIASALRVSPYHLSHVFGRESDFTLSSYLTKVRMDKARALLIKGDMTVAEVAEAVGFESANYFSKVFSKHCGCAPSEFAAGAGR